MRALHQGALRPVKRWWVVSGGLGRRVTRARVQTTAGLKTVFRAAASLSATASPDYASGSSQFNQVLTGAVTAAVAGGLGPYSYAWTITGYDAFNPPAATSPNQATTAFRQSGLAFGEGANATARCTVVDATGQQATADVSLYFERSSGSGGGVPIQ